MSTVFINPNLVVQRNDPLTTGVVYMPISLAYAVAFVRKAGFEVNVIDAFGEAPEQAFKDEKFFYFGLSYHEIIERMAHDCKMAFVYAINCTNHNSTVGIVKAIKAARPEVKVVIMENTQAVTAYALKNVAHEFLSIGADFILTGEAEKRAVKLLEAIGAKIPDGDIRLEGVGTSSHYQPPADVIEDLDSLPFPAWDLFPIDNYWDLRFAHGPQTSPKYMPLLTSRGCPYPCTFCVVPATNNQKWRARSAGNVVDEMEHYVRTFDVHEFHIEDVDPTISDERIRQICREILNRKLKVTWKLAAGTKVETIRGEQTVDLMAEAGCRYISISPETGSPRLLKCMQKPFNLNHAVKIVNRMNEAGIKSQACFVLGFPTETDEDRQMTRRLVKDLTRKGVDEIACFIITPVPGSAIAKEFSGYQSVSDLNFTPTWREDYKQLVTFRFNLYRDFLFWKTMSHPLKMIKQCINFALRHFETKMEMVPYRAVVFTWSGMKAKGLEPVFRPAEDATLTTGEKVT